MGEGRSVRIDETQTAEDRRGYESPLLVEVGLVSEVVKGQYSRTYSDDGDADGYWDR